MARKTYGNIAEDKYLEAIDWIAEGGTKKGACDILGVKSNPVMERLINEYIEGKARDKRLRAEKRKIAITDSEVVDWITSYLNGCTLGDLSNTYYRSIDVIKERIERHGALLRQQEKIDLLNPPLLPDLCVAESFKVGQYVWSAKYACIAQVMRVVSPDAYRIQVLGNGRQESSYQPSWELGDLTHLEKLGVKLEAFEDYMRLEEVQATVAQTMRDANKRAKEDKR